MKRMNQAAGVLFLVLVVSPVSALADWASEVAASNPLHWWRFEETSGTTVADSGSGGLAGTLVNGATLGHSGLVGGAVHLDGGTNAHVLLGGTPLDAPWTLEAVFHQDDTTAGASSALLGPEMFGAPNTAIKSEQWNATGQMGYTAFGVVDVTFGNAAAATPSSFTHVAMVGTATGVELFVNGTAVEMGATPIALPRGIIGLSGFSGTGAPIDAFGGFVDELVIYDRALSATEIGAHFAAIPEPATLSLALILLWAAAVGLRRGGGRWCEPRMGR